MPNPVEMVSWIGDDNNAIRDLVRNRMVPRIRDAADHPAVQQWSKIQFGHEDQEREAEAMLYWVRRHMTYTPDPVDIEHIKWPSALFYEINRLGSATGDCDDYVMLYATLTASRGIPTQVRIAARHQVVDATGEYQFDHIYVRVKLNSGQAWTVVDPSSEGALGWEVATYNTEDFDV